MSKCMDYNEKLEKIKSDHRKLLEIAMESIAENGQELGDKIHAIFNCIEYDEKQANKYKALLDAKYTIENLVNMILNATTPEEIIKIRESLNYYINKIKKEMVSRNLSDDMITSYQRQASYLRKDIAKSIRILKRENNIDSIEGLIMLSDVVIPDDDQTLKKMIRNEMKFNDYYLKPRKVKIPKDGQSIDSPDEEPKKNDNQTIVQNTDYFDLSKRLDETFAILENPKDDGLEIHDIEEAFKPLLSDREIHENVEKNYDAFEGLKTKTIDNSSKYASEKDFLYAMANRYTRQYRIENPKEYGTSTGKNIVRFFGNIPTYICNKQAVSEMQYDSSVFYSGSDFVSFIEYTRRKNSIRNALKSVFNKSYLNSFEGQCLNEHKKCVEWMQAYCRENGLEVNYVNQRILSNL